MLPKVTLSKLTNLMSSIPMTERENFKYQLLYFFVFLGALQNYCRVSSLLFYDCIHLDVS